MRVKGKTRLRPLIIRIFLVQSVKNEGGKKLGRPNGTFQLVSSLGISSLFLRSQGIIGEIHGVCYPLFPSIYCKFN